MYLFYIIRFMAQQLLSVPLNKDFFGGKKTNLLRWTAPFELLSLERDINLKER